MIDISTAQDEILKLVRTSQDTMVDALQTWTATVQSVTPNLPKLNLPYTDLLHADGTFRTPNEIRARLAQAGVDGSRPVITSCGSGVTACILTLGLRLAGLPEGSVYDGSWTEWGGRSDTPVETNQA